MCTITIRNFWIHNDLVLNRKKRGLKMNEENADKVNSDRNNPRRRQREELDSKQSSSSSSDNSFHEASEDTKR